MTEEAFTKEKIRDMLREEVCLVTFTKVNGEERDMACTLLESRVPDDKKPKGTGAPENESVLRVFDVEKSDWRSFRIDSVKRVVVL